MRAPVLGGQTSPWTVSDTPPATYDAPGFDEPGVTSLFYDGPTWRGKPTRVFAWLGLPERRGRERAPGMVLVHGGGGCAFADWVRLWTARGYAAIAMDTSGQTPDSGPHRRDHHPMGGPGGWGGYEAALEPPTEQWGYHAVEAILRAHTLLRARPEVDPQRIGLTGISWGGVLAGIVAGHDPRLRFVIPVYGCGYLRESPGLGLDKAPEANAARWDALWDPSHHLPAARMPMLWMNGTNDAHFTPPMWQRSHRLPRGPKTLTFPLRMPHGHAPGQTPSEIHAFADTHCKGGEPLPRAGRLERRGDTLRTRFDVPRPLAAAELLLTSDADSPWPARLWRSLPLTLEPDGRSVRATLPPDTALCCVQAVDARGNRVSTEWAEIAAPPQR